MRVGIVTGTGTYALPDLEAGEPREVSTPFGPALVNPGRVGEVEVLHVSRHGEGHARLSNHVNHRANVAALVEMGADCVLGVTVCGAVDSTVPLGSLLVFDDLHFLPNRLPDGSLCTLYGEPGDRLRGHWIFESPFAAEPRRVLLAGAEATGHPVRDGGCYGHVDGPRFNSRAEIRMLAQCGVSAVSQTAAAEAVLCGEAELPFALLGYATDYANGVAEEATPVEELMRLIGESGEVFSAVLSEALPLLAPDALAPSGTVYRFEGLTVARRVHAAGGVIRRTGEGGALEVALIHRPKYADWSLPKGKLEAGESHAEAALREVEEETGLTCRLGRELEAVSYTDPKGRPKTVRYWEMTVESGEFRVNREVDELRWLALDAAAAKLTHGRDRDVIAAISGG